MNMGMRATIAAAGLVSLLALTACESPAPYAPLDGNSTGYTDQRIAANRWRVTFTGNSVTPRETVETYLMRRAAEVTEQSGYRWFVFDTRDTQAHTSYHTEFDPWVGWGGWHRGFGWYGWYGPPGYADTYSTTRFQAYAEIVMLTPEQAKGEPRAIEASDVLNHLVPSAPMGAPPPAPPPGSAPPRSY